MFVRNPRFTHLFNLVRHKTFLLSLKTIQYRSFLEHHNSKNNDTQFECSNKAESNWPWLCHFRATRFRITSPQDTRIQMHYKEPWYQNAEEYFSLLLLYFYCHCIHAKQVDLTVNIRTAITPSFIIFGFRFLSTPDTKYMVTWRNPCMKAYNFLRTSLSHIKYSFNRIINGEC